MPISLSLLSNAHPESRFEGYVVYSIDNHPIGIVSSTGEKAATCHLNRVPKHFTTYLTSIEDRRYFFHSGFDIKGIARATYKNIAAGKIVQGGSTLTQQLARNFLRDNRTNLTRKLREFVLARDLEKRYSKGEILELYYNHVFWGRSVYGLRAASLEYFSKEPNQLSTAEQLALIALLRGPNYYLREPNELKKRYHLLNNLLRARNVLDSKKYSKTRGASYAMGRNNLAAFGNKTVKFIAKQIDYGLCSISSSIDRNLQNEAIKFVKESPYPTSIIGLSRPGIIVAASTFGSDYPFVFRSNVGSTLKPLIYTYIREHGVAYDDLFSTHSERYVEWDVHEFQSVEKKKISLCEALKLSNNNAFLNASYENGIDEILAYLAQIFRHPKDQFVPASILGATVGGITLYDLVRAYYDHFIVNGHLPSHLECLTIMNEIAREKLNVDDCRLFMKTGTTNQNRERFALLGRARILFGFLRQGNEKNDYSKEGSFIAGIMAFLKRISNKKYRWE